MLSLLLGTAVIIGWLTGQFWLTRVRTDFAPMQFLTALGFVLCGAGLLALALNRNRPIAVACGGILSATALILCLQYATGQDLGISLILPLLPTADGTTTALPSPPAALCYLLSGLALLVAKPASFSIFRRFAVWTLASLALSLALMALCGYFTGLSGTYVWGPFIGMALHTALGMVAVSAGLLAMQLKDGRSLANDGMLPVPVAIATVTATVILWQALLADRYKTLEVRAGIIAENIRLDVQARLDGPLRALERMKKRWDLSGGTTLAEWQADADSYVADEKVFSSIEWADKSLVVRWVAPQSQRFLIGASLEEDRRWPAAESLARSREDNEMVLTPAIYLRQGGRGFLACVPLFPDGEFNGFLIGAIRSRNLLEEALDEELFTGYAIAVYEGETRLFARGLADASSAMPTAESTVDLFGHQWRVTVAPLTNALHAAEGVLPTIVLSLGLLLSAALTVATRALQQMRRQADEIRHKNRNLKREIAERKRFESRLQESEERLRTVLDSATGVAVISADPNGMITYFSKGAERILGYTKEEMVGRATPAVFHDPEEVRMRGEELGKTVGFTVEGFDVFVTIPRRRGSERREWTYVCKDGCRRTVELTVTVLRGTGGDEIRGYLGTAMDITFRKEMEQSLLETVRATKRAEALLRSAGRTARLGHWELPLDGDTVKWSDMVYEIHEVPVGEPITLERALDFFHPEDREMVRTCVAEAARSGESFDFEARLVTGRSREIWVHSRGESVRDDSGSVVELRGVLQDVDERHRAADLLEKRNRELDIARQQAESHARAKAEFLANMSHEIRTPLNAVIGISDILMDSALPPHEKELTATVRRSADVLLGLLNDILDFSKIESGQLEMERIAVNLTECIESALDIVASQAAAKNLDLVYWIDPDVPDAIVGDLTRLRQIVVNLVANAIKFTGEGEVFVRVSRVKAGKEKDRLRIAVRDSGIGIPRDRMGRLFQAFSQVDASTTRRYGGTGLGLAIAHRLVELMDGRIWAESEEGRGSTFQFEIPLHEAEIPRTEPEGESEVRNLQGLRVLVVDDNETNRWILQMQTSSWGMLPVVCDTPQRALDLIRLGEELDLAILDVMMPGMDGYQLAGAIRKLRTQKQLPIIMLTSIGDHRRNSGSLGLAGVLTKPVKVTPLFNALCAMMGRIPRSGEQSGEDLENEKHGERYPLRILVAEDNVVNQRVTELLLRKLGYRAQIVANGLEVLTALTEGEFDAVLLDVQMPEMDGLETAREICKRHARSERPWVIAMTAHSLDGDREGCLAAGMDDYLSKPVRLKALATTLRNAHGHVSAS